MLLVVVGILPCFGQEHNNGYPAEKCCVLLSFVLFLFTDLLEVQWISLNKKSKRIAVLFVIGFFFKIQNWCLHFLPINYLPHHKAPLFKWRGFSASSKLCRVCFPLCLFLLEKSLFSCLFVWLKLSFQCRPMGHFQHRTMQWIKLIKVVTKDQSSFHEVSFLQTLLWILLI